MYAVVLARRRDVVDDVVDDAEMTSGVTLRSARDASQRPTSIIAERLTQLYESQESWRSKVEEKDVEQFTVEGKMNRLGEHSVSLARRRRLAFLKPTSDDR